VPQHKRCRRRTLDTPDNSNTSSIGGTNASADEAKLIRMSQFFNAQSGVLTFDKTIW
jgi:hypothetical protein